MSPKSSNLNTLTRWYLPGNNPTPCYPIANEMREGTIKCSPHSNESEPDDPIPCYLVTAERTFSPGKATPCSQKLRVREDEARTTQSPADFGLTAAETGDYADMSELTGLKTFVTNFAGHIAAEAAR